MILAAIYNLKHVIGLTFVILLVIALFYGVNRFKWSNEKVYFSLFVAFYVLEFMKILLMILDGGGYPLNHLPFHLCSLPLYVSPFLAFVNNKKVLDYIKPAAFATVLFGGTIALLYPVNIIGSESWLPLKENVIEMVSFNYHALMIFLPLYMIQTKDYVIEWKKLKYAFLASFVFMVLAIIVNALRRDQTLP